MVRMEIYIDADKATVRGNSPYGPSPHSIRRRLGSLEGNLAIIKTAFLDLTQEDRAMADLAIEFAVSQGADWKFYDVSRFGHRFRASLHGVREFPAVRIGKFKFTGSVTKAELEAAFKGS